MLFFLLFSSKVSASETQEKLDRAREAARQTQGAIDSNQDTIDLLSGTHSALEGQLSELNSRLAGISAELNDLDERIGAKEDEIGSTQKDLEETQELLKQTQEDLADAENRHREQYEAMKQRVRFLYEKGQRYYLEILLEADTFGDYLNRKSYIEKMSAYDQRMLEEYRKTAEDIAKRKAQIEEEEKALKEQQELLEKEQEELQGLRGDQLSRQNEVHGLVSQTAGSISLTKEQLSDAHAAADALKEQLEQQNREISALEKQLEEERRLQALSDASVWRDISQVEFAEGDRYLLANLIYCEAGNQPYEGQVAVGAVVINRLLSGAFPNTISGVIYQSWQFEPAATGRLAIALAKDEATPACYEAADAAMQGQTTVADCLFFRTPIPQITPRYTIGGHIFY